MNTDDAQVTETDIVEAEAKTEEVTETKEGADLKEVKEPSEPSPEKKSVQKRMNELTWKHRESERQNQALQDRLNELEAKQPPPDNEVKTLEDFEYDEGKFQTYLTDKITVKAVEAARAVATEGQSQITEQAKIATFETKEKRYSEDLPDYFDATRNLPYFSKPMFDAVSGMEEGPAVFYFLAKNEDVAAKISSLPQSAAGVEIGRIASKLATGKATSKAPAPPPKIDGLEPGIEKNPDKMNVSEWREWRRKQRDKLRKT